MLTRLDHVVILVRDLDVAVAGYERLGFVVTPGGEHADGLTRNALIPFEDGSYFELLAFLDPEDSRDNVWGWRKFLPHGGLIDYCVASDDLDSDVSRLESLGFEMDGPDDGGRRLPDGTQIRWRSARIRQEGRLLPFLIEDLTPREERVPGGPAADHPNGASGLSRLEIATPDAGEATSSLAALIETPDDTAVRLGACLLSPVAAEREDAARRLDTGGAGPLAVDLVWQKPARAKVLDPLLTRGVGIRFPARTSEV
ncbi:MAG TPA: VOC family protein [Rubrobacter sp.]|nr:VOC family protein [Rubrobacter sp.]